MQRLTDAPLAGEVHSVFTHAVNIETASGMLTLLTRGRSLLPFSIVCDTQDPFPAMGWERGLSLTLDKRQLAARPATVVLTGVAPTTLGICRRLQSIGTKRPAAAPILCWLTRHADECGLSPLLTNIGSNPYVTLIASRLPAFLQAVDAGAADAAASAAARMAGCGMGLTPSSDDLLCGYMAALHALSACGAGYEQSVLLPMTQKIAARAAEKTNRISAAFLLQSGDGYASDDLIQLFEALITDANEAKVQSAAERVGCFGSTSGADILTGAALALMLPHDFTYRR